MSAWCTTLLDLRQFDLPCAEQKLVEKDELSGGIVGRVDHRFLPSFFVSSFLPFSPIG